MDKIVLIDGNSILNRAFYGVPMLTNSEGVHTNAVFGFLNIMFSILDEEKPKYLAVAFDLKAPTFRHKLYPEYKGTRKPASPDFIEQIPLIKEVLRSMNILVMEKEGYEADDILGTFAKKAQNSGLSVSLVSGDRDLLQVSDSNILIRIPKTKGGKTEIENYYPEDVVNAYGVTPRAFIDVKAIMGDTSDNIPGIPKVGEKTAINLIREYGSLDGLYANVDALKKGVVKENIINNKEEAYFYQKLVTIELNADIPYVLDDAAIGEFYNENSYEVYTKLGLKKFLSRFNDDVVSVKSFELPKVISVNINELDKTNLGDDNFVGFFAEFDISCNKPVQMSLFDMGNTASDNRTGIYIKSCSFATKDAIYNVVADSVDAGFLLKDTVKKLFFTDSERVYAVYNMAELLEMFDLEELQAYECQAFSKHFFDIKIASYVCDPTRNGYEPDDLSLYYLNKQYNREDNMLTEYYSYVCLMSSEVIRAKLDETNQSYIFDSIDMPLSVCLYEMKKLGIKLDTVYLSEFSKELSSSIDILEGDIYSLAGEEFNINSPKQLGEVLFEKLKLQGGKKTKTGYSTSAEVLEKLADDNEIAAKIIEYRTLCKLKNTYADALPECMGEDGRVHTTFEQTVTATGRLSSVNPNLQNIPIRTELGRMIRKAFVPKKDYIFVDADYSQVELRIMAHLSGEEALIEAFNEGNDIHAITASRVFNVPLSEVTSLQRRRAKAVNFGVIYGISSFGLSKDLMLTQSEAKKYIDEYFETYPKVLEYLNSSVIDATDKGYSETMYGRKRTISELKASQFMVRKFGERVAMNAPIQGTAADIMKLAMINVRNRLLREKLNSRILIQVHDELLIEADINEKEAVLKILQEEMESAAALKVRLEVSATTGKDWYEAK